MERIFPRKTRRHVSRTLAVICTLSVACATALSGAQADKLHDKKHKIQQGIKHAQEDLDGTSRVLLAANKQLASAQAQLVAAQKQLSVTEGQLTAARVLDQQMQAKLAQAEQALADAEAAVTAGAAKVVQQRADIGRLAAADYQYGDPRLLGLSMILRSQDPVELASQLNTIDSVMAREKTMLEDLNATEALLKVQRDKVSAAKELVAEQRQAAAVNLAKRQELEQEAAQKQAQVAALVSARQTAVRAAAQARAQDALRLRRMKREENRIKALIIERAKHEKGGYSGGSGGFLLHPVAHSWITSPYGWRRHPIYGYWGLHNGDDFHAPCGTPEIASASGTVIDEYFSSVWGNRLFLDVGKFNGKAMTLVYNHISVYRAHSGQRVKRGQVIALAGTTGWSTGCHLHFTVMLNGTAVNPTQFF